MEVTDVPVPSNSQCNRLTAPLTYCLTSWWPVKESSSCHQLWKLIIFHLTKFWWEAINNVKPPTVRKLSNSSYSLQILPTILVIFRFLTEMILDWFLISSIVGLLCQTEITFNCLGFLQYHTLNLRPMLVIYSGVFMDGRREVVNGMNRQWEQLGLLTEWAGLPMTGPLAWIALCCEHAIHIDTIHFIFVITTHLMDIKG